MAANVSEIEIGVDETLDAGSTGAAAGGDDGFNVVSARKRRGLPPNVTVRVHAASDLRRADLGGLGKSDPCGTCGTAIHDPKPFFLE